MKNVMRGGVPIKAKVTAYLLENLLHEHFVTKKEMAEHLNIPYRMLLRVFSRSCSKKDLDCVMDKLVRHCMANEIELKGTLKGLPLNE